MIVEVQAILNQNITVVYDSLDLHDIDSGKLKALMGRETRATVMDTPEMMVAVYPPAPTIIQIGDHRIRINLPKNASELGQVPIWDLAAKSAELVPDDSAPVAYGFNYDVGITIGSVNVIDLLIQLFVREPETLSQRLGGQLFSTVPRFRFMRNETRYDLVLEPLDQERLKVHLNVHFDLNVHTLPETDALERAYEAEYEYLLSTLSHLLESS